MHRSRRLLGLLILLAACGDPSRPGDPSITGTSLDFSAFDRGIETFMAGQSLQGAVAVVVHRDLGTVHLKGYGAFATDRPFLIASSSKILSVGVLMRLADQKRIDIDKPIGTVVGGAWGEGKAGLTVAQLLSNSSGLVGLQEEATYPPYLCQFVPSGNLTACAQRIYGAADSDRIVPPDTRFKYGGGQWQLAGGIAELAGGKPWAQLIRETYVEPCGADSLGYTNPFSRAGANAYPAFFMANVANLDRTDNPSIEGGAYVTVGDYGKILLMHVRRGLCGDTRVLSEAAVARMQQDRIGPAYGGATQDRTLPGYGLGWWVDRVNPVVADPGAYGSVAWIDNARGYGVFVALEATALLGAQLRIQTKPVVDGIFDSQSSKR